VEIHVDKGQEDVVVKIRADDRNDLDSNPHQNENDQIVLVLKEFKDPSIVQRCVNLVRVDQPQTTHEIDKVETAVQRVENGTIGVLDLAPVEGKVVVGVDQRVEHQLDRKEGYHQDAEQRRTLLHQVVVLEDKPLLSDTHRRRHHNQHETHSQVDLRVHLLLLTGVVLAITEQLHTVSTHH
jgi:hypothetical protein